MDNILGIQDYIITPILFLLILAGANAYAKNKYGSSTLYKHFVYGLLLKLVGSLLVGIIFMFYYEKGDTFFYFLRSKYLTYLFTQNPIENWKVYFAELFRDDVINIPGFNMNYLAKANAYMVVRIASILNVFLFDSFFSTSLMFAVFGFIGSWKLYQVFLYHYPELVKEIGISTLFLPCIVIWGSGLSKDTISFGSMGILIYCMHAITIRKTFKFSYVFYILISIYLIGVIKPYILMALLPSLVFFQVNNFSSKLSSSFLRTTLFPVILLIVAAGSFGALSILNTTFSQYNLDNMEDKLEGFQRWHTVRSEQTEGSGYTLGSGGTSPSELLIKFPLAVNVTLFRPYLWESRKPIVFLSAIESLYVFVLTIGAFRKIGFRGMLEMLFYDPFISFCFVFAIIFAFAVGISAFNFGALVRFKIPCMPFYLMAIFMSKQKSITKYA